MIGAMYALELQRRERGGSWIVQAWHVKARGRNRDQLLGANWRRPVWERKKMEVGREGKEEEEDLWQEQQGGREERPEPGRKKRIRVGGEGKEDRQEVDCNYNVLNTHTRTTEEDLVLLLLLQYLTRLLKCRQIVTEMIQDYVTPGRKALRLFPAWVLFHTTPELGNLDVRGCERVTWRAVLGGE
jgi:hypothetical protein